MARFSTLVFLFVAVIGTFKAQRQRGGIRGDFGGNKNSGRITEDTDGPLVAKDGSATCDTWNQYTLQTPAVWDKLGSVDFVELEEKVLNLLDANTCKRGSRTNYLDQETGCPSYAGKCDSAENKLKVDSVFYTNTVTYRRQQYRLVVSNAIPNHCYQIEATKENPNNACEMYTAVLLPLNPVVSTTYKEHGMGAIGIATSGAFFYNHKSAEAECNAAAVTEVNTFDPCDGHSDGGCAYHYHKAPVCMKGFDSCELLGYINDGFAVYGKCTVTMQNGSQVQMTTGYELLADKNGCDVSHYEYVGSGVLDKANGYNFSESAVGQNGHKFAAGTYAYFFTPAFPYIMPGTYATEVARSCAFSVDDL